MQSAALPPAGAMPDLSTSEALPISPDATAHWMTAGLINRGQPAADAPEGEGVDVVDRLAAALQATADDSSDSGLEDITGLDLHNRLVDEIFAGPSEPLAMLDRWDLPDERQDLS